MSFITVDKGAIIKCMENRIFDVEPKNLSGFETDCKQKYYEFLKKLS